MKRLLILLLIFPSSLYGESIAPYPVDTRVANVLSAVSPNFNSVGSIKAVLVQSGPSQADLYIYRGPLDLVPTVYMQGIAWVGETEGAMPWLAYSDAGAVELHSENMSFGRHRWHSTLTIVQRGHRFYVASFSYSMMDTLDLDNFSSCYFDFVNGTQSFDGPDIADNMLKVEPQEILLRDWQAPLTTTPCY